MYSHVSLHLILWILGTTVAQDVIFDNIGFSNSCTTRDGGSGRCVDIRKCPEIRETFLTNRPVLCGFSRTFPIVCCPVPAEPVTEDPKTVPGLGISAPAFSPNFVCGRSTTKTISNNQRFQRATRSIGTLEVGPIGPEALTPPPPVVGGQDSERNAWPWMALIGAKEKIIGEGNLFPVGSIGGGNFNAGSISGGIFPGGNFGRISWFCGGVLINDQWVLTAAHCLGSGKTPDTVRLGEHNYNDRFDGANHQDFDIIKMVRHPDYAVPAAYHDLALLQLSTKVTLQRFISPVCLPWGDESKKNLIDKKVKLTGWGDTQFAGNPSSILQEVDITMFSPSRCQKSYSRLRQFRQNWPNGMGEETVCAGDVNGGRDACQGDSGGPITYRSNNGKYVVNGIVSTGYGCGSEHYPGIYANLQYPSHLAWIKKVAF